MSTLIQDIQTVRSLRKDLRDPKLPLSILNAIESVHNCIKSGTDLNGWKKVDWRGGSGGGGGGGGSSGNRSGQTSNSSKSSFFGNRGDNRGSSYGGDNRGDNRGSSYGGDNRGNNSAFGNSMNRSRPPIFTSSKPAQEQPKSIPLSSPTSSVTPVQSTTGGNATNATNATTTTTTTTTTNASNTTNTTVQNNNSGFITHNNKYVSRFKKNTEQVEDTILNTIILGKLNKFSVANYDEIKEFITHIIASGQSDMIKCFMRLVFQKAASEEMFCPLYAKLLSELSSRYPELLTEMANLYEQYMAIFEEVETSAEDYNELVKRNVEKKYRRGYSQFLAELIKHQVINKDVFLKTIDTIIKQVNNKLNDTDSIKLIEEYADCMMKIMKAIDCDDTDNDSDSDDEDNKYKMMNEIKDTLKSSVYNNIKPLTEKRDDNCGLSTKARFTFLDIYETINRF